MTDNHAQLNSGEGPNVWRARLARLRADLPFLVIGAFFFWALAAVLMNRAEESPPGIRVIRLSHWQLEPGFQAAIDQLAEEYSKLHPDVKIVQEAIPETSYGQWCSTQLMGGTAPDLMEMGKGLPHHIWISYYNRYMLSLTEYVNRPNPYNAGTDLAGEPLRGTYKDGMRTAYIDELQEYMNVPLTQLSIRLFYNKTLLKRLTGLDEAPQDYRSFLDVCKTIKESRTPEGDAYFPIAGSKFHVGMWNSKMFYPLTYSAYRQADFNLDGYVSNYEQYVAFRAGLLTMEAPVYRAMFAMMREVLDHFQPGYIGLTRDEAVFSFAQQKAVFIATGTWDCRSLQVQAEGMFEIGVMDFPWPDTDDPVYGEFVEGPVYDRPLTLVAFAVNRYSENADVAIDFLLFLASQKQNETLNEIIGWTPCIRGAKTLGLLLAFEPKLRGIYPAWNPNLGGESWIKWLQMESLFKVNQVSYEDLCAEFGPFYVEQGYKDYLETTKDWRRGLNKQEHFIVGVRAEALSAGGEEAVSRWAKYRSLVAGRLVFSELGHAQRNLMVERGLSGTAEAPYIYDEALLERIRQNMVKQGCAGVPQRTTDNGRGTN